MIYFRSSSPCSVVPSPFLECSATPSSLFECFDCVARVSAVVERCLHAIVQECLTYSSPLELSASTPLFVSRIRSFYRSKLWPLPIFVMDNTALVRISNPSTPVRFTAYEHFQNVDPFQHPELFLNLPWFTTHYWRYRE